MSIILTKSGCVAPQVHLNGTLKKDLVKQNVDASMAVLDAIEVLKRSTPHARDYYVQDDGAFRTACDQHQERMRQLVAIKDQLFDIAKAVNEQPGR